jgi:hypothetical protein
MRVEVIVESVGEGIHEPLEPYRALRVLRLECARIDEQLIAQIEVDRRLTVGQRPPTEHADVVRLYPVEVVLSLRILHAKHRVGVSLAVYVGNAPIVTIEGDVASLALPARDVAGARGCRGTRLRAGSRRNEE